MSTTPGDGPQAAPLPTSTPTATGPNAEGTPFPRQSDDDAPVDQSSPPTPTTGAKQQATSEQAAPPLKLFTLNDAPPTVPANVHLPGLLENHAPFGFILRLTFSEHMQKKRDSFLALAPTKQVESEDEEILAELCDLLAQDPTGFGDYNAATVGAGLGSPGAKLRAYYNAAEKRSPQAFAIVKSVVRAANNIYWGKVTPREYFPSPANNSAGEPTT